MLRGLALFAFLLCALFVQGQYVSTPLNEGHARLLEAYQLQHRTDERVSAFKPGLVQVKQLDSLRQGDTQTWTRKRYNSWVMRKLRHEHLIEVRKDDFYLNGDFVFDLTVGRDLNDAQQGTIYTNTRGFQFEGTVGKRVFFSSTFYENQSIFPAYLDNVVADRESVPGLGRYKTFENFAGDTAYDYAFATGAAGVAFSRYSFIQLGYDRQFVGHGFRSLLLSDASFPYPFFRGNIGFLDGRVQYSITWATLQGTERVPLGLERGKEFPFQRKRAKFSYLSVFPTHWFSVGLFTAVLQRVWTDSSHVDADFDYYLPSGLLSYAASDDDVNRTIGINASIQPLNQLRFYGQYAQYRYWSDDAFQIGVQLLDPLKWNHLSFRAEFNSGNVNDLTQDTLGNPLSGELAFTHNGQFLGHPLDGPFDELLIQGSIRLRDFQFSGTLMRYQREFPLTGLPTASITYINAEAAYIVNPMSLAKVVMGATYRTDDVLPSTQFIYFGFRTALLDRYSEF